MSGFTLLWSKTLDSSLWIKESKETKILWFALMMMKDKDGIIHASQVGLAKRAGLTDEECSVSLKVLLSPDPNDTSKVEEGRRIREVHGGWQLVNHETYRFSTPERREFWRQQKAEQRAKADAKIKPKRKRAVSNNGSGALPGELEHEAAIKRGASREEQEAIVEKHL